jgi:hypothetical protein
MKRKITLSVFTLLVAFCSASDYVNKVIVLNEGHYDYVNMIQTVPVTVGAYNPVSHVYTPFDTIPNARFASDVIVAGADIFVAADSQLIRYDAETYARLATANVRGIRKVAVWNNQLLVSRGEYLQTFTSYFQVYDKNSLQFMYELPVTSGPQYASEGIVVKNDVAYIAINNGFDWSNEVGFVGRIDLAAQNYLGEIDLGTGGKNPENIILDNDRIFTVNNTDYTTASVSRIDISSLLVSTTNLMTTTGCGASVVASNYVLFQPMGDVSLGRFNTSTSGLDGSLAINRNIYGMAADEINDLLYVGETDYSTYGKVIMYDFAGVAVDSFDVNVSPGNIALDIRTSTGVGSIQPASSLFCSPNPVHDLARIFVNGKNFSTNTLILTDIAGRTVKKIVTDSPEFSLDVQSLEAGIYFLQSTSQLNEKIKIVKQ